MIGQFEKNIGTASTNKSFADIKQNQKNSVSASIQQEKVIKPASLNFSPSAVSGASLVKKSSHETKPRISVCFKTGKTEKEKTYEKIEKLSLKLLKQVGVKNFEKINNDEADVIFLKALSAKKDFRLPANEKAEIEQVLLSYHGHDDKDYYKSYSDENICNALFSALCSESQYDSLYHLMYAMKKNAKISDEEFNPREKANEIRKKYNKDELYFIYCYLNDACYISDEKEQRKRLFADFSKLYTRNIFDILKNQLSLGYVCTDYVQEFFDCSDDEFLEKIDKLNKRPYLIDNINNLSYKTWSGFLAMPDEEYDKLAVPVEQRKETEAVNYKAELESMLNEAFNYDIKEALEITKKNMADDEYKCQLAEEHIAYIPKENLFEFKPLKKTAKKIPEEKLFSTSEAMDMLKKTGSVQIEIKNFGGLNPARNEKPVIEKDAKSRLGIVEEAGINIIYGKNINWSNQKIARDILQNFYDGNGHTLEGVKYDIKKGKNGVYTVKISGEGSYSYERLDSLGNSSKNSSKDAGSFGEGTRIVAVNLLSRKDTPFVKYACGDWNMVFSRSSEDLDNAYMTQILNKNEKQVKGNYIELQTKDKALVESLIEAKNYFYSPYNEDFQNLDYENEYFGFKNLKRNEKGNLYVVQRYQVDREMNNGLKKMTLVFKKMPNDPYLKKLNNGQLFPMSEVRDRPSMFDFEIGNLCDLYVKTMDNKSLMGTIASLKDYWILNRKNDLNDKPLILDSLINEAIKRNIGFKFDNETEKVDELRRTGQQNDLDFLAIPENTDINTIEHYMLQGYVPVIPKMANLGIKTPADILQGEIKEKENSISLNKVPDKEQEKKLRLIDKAVSVLRDNLELSSYNQILKEDITAPTLIINPASDVRFSAEAIIDNYKFIGQWLKESCLDNGRFSDLLSTKLHEITHKYGTDDSKAFTDAIINLQLSILKGLVENPVSLEKIRVIESLFENKDICCVSQKFSAEKFKEELLAVLNKPYTYFEYVEDKTSVDSSYRPKTSLSFAQKFSKTLKGVFSNLILSKNSESNEIKEYKLESFPQQENQKDCSSLPDFNELWDILQKDNKILLTIPNQGRMQPVNKEKPVIHNEDIQNLGKTQKAKIKLRYGEKINWSPFKIARDIMQNFYDGNGHTLEGVTVDIEKNENNEYTVKIFGKGNYDYKHLKALGHNKNEDSLNAGSFGEGTRIVAVNMLTNPDVPYVKYACGDWQMTFGKTSDDVNTADMTQTLNRNEKSVEGNFIEFKTKDNDLVKEILKSKDYFYHPYNVDFQNMAYENDYLGVKILENHNKPGNLYLVQRYETDKPLNSLNGINIIFKKSPDDKKLEKLDGKFYLKTRDRVALNNIEIQILAKRYGKAMSNEDLVKLLGTLLPFYTFSSPSEFSKICKGVERSFCQGLIEAALEKGIKLNTDGLKIVSSVSSRSNTAENFLKSKGYKFVPSEMNGLGVKSALQVYDYLNKIHSLKPSNTEEKKLKLLDEAFQLFASNDKARIIPKLDLKDLYVFESENTSHPKVHAEVKDFKINGLFISRDYLEKTDFLTCLTKVISESLRLAGSDESSLYSYALTDLIKSEINILMKNPQVAPKLLMIKKEYNSL